MTIYNTNTKGTALATCQKENWIQDSATGIQVFAWNSTFFSEEIAERVCPTTDTEINVQELTLQAEYQHETLWWQIV